jgi:7-keto-8-aminopelargonate synthetase-like enzyme
VFSTALPPSIAAATLAAIEIVRSGEGEERRRVLAGHARRLRELVPGLGGAAESAIAPWMVGDDREVMRAMARLFERGVFAQGIRPPTVPVGTARLRLSLCAGLSGQQVENAGRMLNDAVQQ